MIWLISTEIDSEEELLERMVYYSRLRKRELHRNHRFESQLAGLIHVFNDGNSDNRIMIVGHSDFPIRIISELKKSRLGKNECFSFFVCACIMSVDTFYSKSGIGADDEVYVTEQILEEIEGTACYTCEFLDKAVTRMGFKATKTELSLNLPKLEGRSFYGNLKRCFVPLQNYITQE